MKRRTFLALVPATATATTGCVVQDRSTALGGSQVAPEAKAVVDFEYHPDDGTVTVTLVHATGFERGVVDRVFVVEDTDPQIDWVNAETPESARAKLPLDDGDSLTVEASPGTDLRVAVAMAADDSSTVVGQYEVPGSPTTTTNAGEVSR